MHHTVTHSGNGTLGNDKRIIDDKLQEVRALADELKELIQRDTTTFDDDILRRQMDVMDRAIEYYRLGLIGLDQFFENGMALLVDLRDRLKLAADEQQRLESEGGNPASTDQLEKNERLVKALRRSETLISNMESLFPAGKH